MSNAVAYYRTSSAANVGADKDSMVRQQEAVRAYLAPTNIALLEEFYDAAVSGADPVDTRPGFLAMLAYCADHGVTTVLVENASRFARDLMVQLTGHALLKKLGIELIPVDAPTFFTDPTPTSVLIQQILGAVSQFEKAALVAKLKGARDRKRAATGRCEGRKPPPLAHVTMAKMLRAVDPKLSLRAIAAEMYAAGSFPISGRPYLAGSIQAMLS